MKPVSLFFNHMMNRLQDFESSGCLFVHYTSASTFLSILKNKEVWLRHTSLMNDYEEIERGVRSVTNFFLEENESSSLFWRTLDDCFEDVSDEIKGRYDSSLKDLRHNTFVMSLSGHLKKEDGIGRLSMWRAYAPKDGVAIVLNPEKFYEEENKLNVFSYPVLYWSDKEIENNLSFTVKFVSVNKEVLLKMGRDEVVAQVLEMLVSYAICLKHPGFEEEQEMRLVYRPGDKVSLATEKSVEICGTTPQIIHKMSLAVEWGTDLDVLLNSVILGPSQSNFEMKEAILCAMIDAKISNPTEKVFLSDIPLRT